MLPTEILQFRSKIHDQIIKEIKEGIEAEFWINLMKQNNKR